MTQQISRAFAKVSSVSARVGKLLVRLFIVTILEVVASCIVTFTACHRRLQRLFRVCCNGTASEHGCPPRLGLIAKPEVVQTKA